MTPMQRFAAWLAAVTLVPPGRAADGFEPIAYPQGVADKGWGELHQEMDDAREAWRQNPLARRLVGMVTAYVVGNGITLRSEYAPLQRFIDDFWQAQPDGPAHPRMVRRAVPGGRNLPGPLHQPQDRTSTVRCVPASIVERIEWREGDYEAELRYKEVGAAGESGRALVGVAAASRRRRPRHAGDAPLRRQPPRRRPARRVGPGADPALAQALQPLARRPRPPQRRRAGVSLGGQGPGPPAHRAGRTLPPAARAGSVIIADEQESWTVARCGSSWQSDIASRRSPGR